MSSGIVISRPRRVHECSPGWEWREPTPGALPPLPAGMLVGVAPDPWRFPAGTMWACDCGRTWVSLGARYRNAPGLCEWRREGWFQWWRRQRQQVRADRKGSVS